MSGSDAPPPDFSPNHPPPTTNGDAPPPTYSVSQPQILVAPLPDSPSFFWGRTVQGEVFAKGLGGRSDRVNVRSLTVRLHLDDILPNHPTISIIEFDPATLYPPSSVASSSLPADHPFPAIHRFNIPLPKFQLLPGTLNLRSSDRGEVKWFLIVSLTLSSGVVVNETVPIEGTPQEYDPSSDVLDAPPRSGEGEAEEILERSGVRCRMLLDTSRPRLGSLLRLGVEICPMERQKTGVAGLSTQPNPAQTLRPLRRVRVELFRKVTLLPSSEAGSSNNPSNPVQHLALLYTSGKSLRYPGTASQHPPLRVLFTIPTAQLSSSVEQTWGEISQFTPYHSVTFFVRVTIGFGGQDVSPTVDGSWVLERDVEVLPKLWKEPRHVIIQGGELPALGEGDRDALVNDDHLQREAYRIKGLDVVGTTGTVRPGGERHDELPPPFDGAGPSGTTPDAPPEDTGLPSFLESEAQMRAGEAPLPPDVVRSERLVPVNFEGDEVPPISPVDRAVWVGRRGSLGGELSTWVEYDGYETFSVAPPRISDSFGAGGVMDPPQEGDDDANVVGGMMGRLGLEGGGGTTGREFIEQLGLGEGTRVVDLQDDLPPGIDEPSLPALPDFSHHPTSPPRFAAQPPVIDARPHVHVHGQPPPSFAASEAAAAVAAVAGQRRASHSQVNPALPPPPIAPHAAVEGEDAPPEYFGTAGSGAHGGPPAYS